MKVALLASTVLVAASLAVTANTAPDASRPATSAPACHPAQSLDLDCALRVADTNGDGTISPTELANFATSSPAAIDWTPLRPPRSTGLDFKDAAIEPASVLPATLERDTSHPLVPALFALGAMVVLLRKRPA
jgi:hypothetical protein